MRKEDLRIVFMGTPEFAVGSLKRLVEGGYNVVAVVSQPDKPVGRHASQLCEPAVKAYAKSVGLPVLQPERLRDEAFLRELKSLRADLQVVVAYRMLPEIVWSMPRFGTFNVHASLLPQYRGAAPINWSVINGETQTGITTFFLDKEIDTGRIIMQHPFDIPDTANVEYVYDGLMALGAELCAKTVDLVAANDGDVPTKEQQTSGELRPAPKIFKDTCRINWSLSAKQVYDFVRGLSPYPGAWTTLSPAETASDSAEIYSDTTSKTAFSTPKTAPAVAEKGGLTLKIYATEKTGEPCQCAEGTLKVEHGRLFVAAEDERLEIKELQLAGKKRMSAHDFLNGFKDIEDFLAL